MAGSIDMNLSTRRAHGLNSGFCSVLAVRQHRQSGVALIVALILLAVIILIGLAAIRGTTVQQKMTANFYDREIAFQNAEAALHAGAAALSSSPTSIINCSAGGNTCEANPFDGTPTAGSIQSVPTGTGSGEFSVSANSVGQPQYVIENMGAYADTSTSTGYGQTANASQYGAQGTSTTSIYYRITARSADPATAHDRAIVTLQAMYRQ